MDSYARLYAGKTIEKANKGEALTEDLPDRGCCVYDNYEAYIEDRQKTGQNTYRRFPEWFEAYAKACVEAFGDRVKI